MSANSFLETYAAHSVVDVLIGDIDREAVHRAQVILRNKELMLSSPSDR